MQIPLDNKISEIEDVPNTISYVIKKRVQLDNLNEIPKDKRPTERMIWEGIPEDIEEWLDRAYDRKKPKQTAEIFISSDEVEG